MGREEIIELLRKDMMGEHQAIIQYLNHAYAMGEGEFACEVEGIAREEMRHYDWLADAIVELGGDPAVARDQPDLAPGSIVGNLMKDVDLEQVAIDQYRQHMEAIDDPKIRRLLARIVHDEMAHKGMFADLAEEAREEGADEPAEGEASPAEPLGERTAQILNQGIRHEYSVILQYLHHSFVTDDKEVSEEMQMSAINEMQHLGWLAEGLMEKGGTPDYSHGELFLSRDDAKNLEADIAVEKEVTNDYSSQIPELGDQGLQELVTRIRDHEIYHEAVFTDLLEEVRAEAKEEAAQSEDETGSSDEDSAPPVIPSVGSLISDK